MKMRKKSLEIWCFDWEVDWRRLARWLLPTPGNILFTLVLVGGLLWASNAGALLLRAPALAGDSTTTISYQGRLLDSDGNPVTGNVSMVFRLYSTDVEGSPLWKEDHPAVPVEDGLFHVLLGSREEPIPVSLLASHSTLWLGITVGADDREMEPREQIASVPYAMIANTVQDGSITTEKIADGAVTTAKLNVDNGLGVSGNVTVTGNVKLIQGYREILFSDPGNYDFSIVHNGGQSLDFRSPEYGGGTTAMSIKNNGNIGIGMADPQWKLHVNGEIQSSTNVILKYATVTTDGSGQARITPYVAVLKPAHYWMECRTGERYWMTDYDFSYNATVGQLSDLFPNCKVVVYYISSPGGQGNPVSSSPDW